MAASTARVQVTVPDMSCAHCVQTVTGALTALDGVLDVAVDLPGKIVTVAYNPDRVTRERMSEVLGAEDYPVVAEQNVP